MALENEHKLREQLGNIRKGKQRGLCRKCVDVFADHEEDRCPRSSGPTNHGLLQCWDQPFHTFMPLLELVKKKVEIFSISFQHVLKFDMFEHVFLKIIKIN